jgi:excisionase family DNA binding protein
MTDEAATIQEAAAELGVHYMTIYRYIRTGRLRATRRAGVWRIDPEDLARLRPGVAGGGAVEVRHPASSSVAKGRSGQVLVRRARLQARLVVGDEAGSWALLESALASDMTPEGVLLDLVSPTLRSIGALWADGELSVADEHRASAVATRLISRLGGRFAPRGRKRGVVVVTAAPGDAHAVPVAIAADLLRWHGFEVVELGADTPAEDLAATAAQAQDLLAVGIVCTTRATAVADGSAQLAIAEVHRAAPDVPVLLGGAAIVCEADALRLGADAFTGGRADDLLRALENIVASAG